MNILRQTLGLTQLLKAGCVSLSRPTATQSLAKEMGNAQIQEEVAGSPEAGSLLAQAHQLVGRESEAHPAISIIPSLDFERYHLPPIQGYKCRVPQIDESLNTANPRPS